MASVPSTIIIPGRVGCAARGNFDRKSDKDRDDSQARSITPVTLETSSSIDAADMSEEGSTHSKVPVWSRDVDVLNATPSARAKRLYSKNADDFAPPKISQSNHALTSTVIQEGRNNPSQKLATITSLPVEDIKQPQIHRDRIISSQKNGINFKQGASPNTIITEEQDPSLYSIRSRTISAASNGSKSSTARAKRREKLMQDSHMISTPNSYDGNVAIVRVSLNSDLQQENSNETIVNNSRATSSARIKRRSKKLSEINPGDSMNEKKKENTTKVIKLLQNLHNLENHQIIGECSSSWHCQIYIKKPTILEKAENGDREISKILPSTSAISSPVLKTKTLEMAAEERSTNSNNLNPTEKLLEIEKRLSPEQRIKPKSITEPFANSIVTPKLQYTTGYELLVSNLSDDISNKYIELNQSNENFEIQIKKNGPKITRKFSVDKINGLAFISNESNLDDFEGSFKVCSVENDNNYVDEYYEEIMESNLNVKDGEKNLESFSEAPSDEYDYDLNSFDDAAIISEDKDTSDNGDYKKTDGDLNFELFSEIDEEIADLHVSNIEQKPKPAWRPNSGISDIGFQYLPPRVRCLYTPNSAPKV
ncbi:hypothetical protein HK100_002722 [Physocladia obscura]|uniref:Uncharacterized protein n=1 Tax=Physocladia obscura TaxID=109957 RepID=A0AAD5T9I8_9FUNG|nr:hypothetical protein HK100_002722 [Physocladia obscura]